MEEKELVVSNWPHIRDNRSIPKIMHSVIAALLPAALVGIYLFGLPAAWVILVCVLGSVLTEAFLQKIRGVEVTISDGSAVLTGLLLALNMPSGAPWWLSLLGSVIAISLGKQVYGGLGHNPFNPALVARAMLLISFPVQMTQWAIPAPGSMMIDAATGATPLGQIQMARLMNKGLGEAANLNIMDAFWGNIGGCIGETSVIALLLGAAYLFYKGIITWDVPFSMVGTVFVFSGIFWLIDPANYANPLFHLFTGGLVLGAFYMATDMVTCPITSRGRLIFGIGCGLLTIIIRMWGGFPEGVSFAILIMNAFTPLIDRYIKPTRYGATAVMEEGRPVA